MNQANTVALLDQVASYLLVKAGCFTLPTDLQAVARLLGVKEIVVTDISTEGYVESIGENEYRVCIRKDRSEQRRNFSLAHELGHVIVHRLNQRAQTRLTRQYRATCQVSTRLDQEAIADYFAAILLIPSHQAVKFLPEDFGIKQIEMVARRAKASIPTALIRSMWFATSHCFAFHIRVYDGRFGSPSCLWTRTSRGIPHITKQIAMEYLESSGFLAGLGTSNSRFLNLNCNSDAVANVESVCSRIDSRQSFYGIARLRRSDGEDLSFKHGRQSVQQSV